MIGDLSGNPRKVLIVAAVLIVLSGSGKLPDAARSPGRSMRIVKSEPSSPHQDEPGPAAQAPGNTPGTPIPQAQLTAASAAFIPDPADQKIQAGALQQQIRDLQRAAALDMAPARAPAEVPQTQQAG